MKTGDPIVFVVDNDSSVREALTDLITSIGLLVEELRHLSLHGSLRAQET